jgi:hypothetical protein
MRLALTPMGAAVMGGRRAFGLNDIIAILGGSPNAVVLDPNDWSTLSQTRYLWTPVTAVGQAVGLALDLSQGLALGPELLGNLTVQLTGTATAATYNTSTGVGTCTRVDALNQSWLQLTGLNSTYTYKVEIVRDAGVAWRVAQTNPAGVQLAGSGVAGIPLTVYFAGAASLAITASVGTAEFTVRSIKHIAGNPVLAPNDGTERPVLVEISPGNYGLQGDGTGDYMVSPNINWTTIPGLAFLLAHVMTNNSAPYYVLNQNSSGSSSMRAVAPSNTGTNTALLAYRGSSADVTRTTTPLSAPAVFGYRYAADTAAGIAINNSVFGTPNNTDAGGSGLSNAPVYLLCRSTLANYSPNPTGRVVVAPLALTDSQMIALSTWINARTGAY